MRLSTICFLSLFSAFHCNSFCWSFTQLLGYAYVCNSLNRDNQFQDMVSTGGFLNPEHGCRECAICRYTYQQNGFWGYWWQDAPEELSLQCTCAIESHIYDHRGTVKRSSLPLESCQNDKTITCPGCLYQGWLKRIENCDGELTCGDCTGRN